MTNTKYQSRVKKDPSEKPRTTAVTKDPCSHAKQTDREFASSVDYKQENHRFVTEFGSQDWFELETENNPGIVGTARPQQRVMNHRLGNRHRSLVLAEIYWRVGQSSAGLIYDLSPGGMFIVSRATPDVNKRVAIVLSMCGNNSFKIPGLVVHSRKYGFGLLFQQLDYEASAFVQKYIG